MLTKTQSDFMWGALLGSAIGAASVLIIAPKSGGKIAKGLNALRRKSVHAERGHNARKRSVGHSRNRRHAKKEA